MKIIAAHFLDYGGEHVEQGVVIDRTRPEARKHIIRKIRSVCVSAIDRLNESRHRTAFLVWNRRMKRAEHEWLSVKASDTPREHIM
jgi:hypothetical protein